jgi:hypothetical protein
VLPQGTAKTLEVFTLEEVRHALLMMKDDPWHKQRWKDLPPSYLLRPAVVDLYRIKYEEKAAEPNREAWMDEVWLEDQKLSAQFREDGHAN